MNWRPDDIISFRRITGVYRAIMDKWVIDIDAVLDEFEELENSHQQEEQNALDADMPSFTSNLLEQESSLESESKGAEGIDDSLVSSTGSVKCVPFPNKHFPVSQDILESSLTVPKNSGDATGTTEQFPLNTCQFVREKQLEQHEGVFRNQSSRENNLSSDGVSNGIQLGTETPTLDKKSVQSGSNDSDSVFSVAKQACEFISLSIKTHATKVSSKDREQNRVETSPAFCFSQDTKRNSSFCNEEKDNIEIVLSVPEKLGAVEHEEIVTDSEHKTKSSAQSSERPFLSKESSTESCAIIEAVASANHLQHISSTVKNLNAKPEASYNEKQAPKLSKVMPLACAGISSEQFEEFLRKKSIENAHLLAGHISPVLKRYQKLASANVVSHSEDDLAYSHALRLPGAASTGNVFERRVNLFCANKEKTLSNNEQSQAAVEVHKTGESEADRLGQTCVPHECVNITDKEALFMEPSIERGGHVLDIATLHSEASATARNLNRENGEFVRRPTTESISYKHNSPHLDQVSYADIADIFSGENSESALLESSVVGDSSCLLAEDTLELNRSPLKSDASNFYRIVSFDMSTVEVTDDDLAQLESELRDERISNSLVRKRSSSVASELFENVANNNCNDNDVTPISSGNGNFDRSTLDFSEVQSTQNHSGSNLLELTSTLNIDKEGTGEYLENTSQEITRRSQIQDNAVSKALPQNVEHADLTDATGVGVTAAQAELDEQNKNLVLASDCGVSQVLACEGACIDNGVGRLESGDSEGVDVLSPSESQLGKVRPLWIQDEDAPICMNCGQDFTIFRRRHHCRACGKVLCSNCCKDRARLRFLDDELARVCSACIYILNKGERATEINSLLGDPTNLAGGSGSKSVVFSDGVRPGGDLTDNDIPSTPPPAQRMPQRTVKRIQSGRFKGSVARKFRSYSSVSDSLGLLPTVLLGKEFPSIEEPMSVETLFDLLQDTSLPPVWFALTRQNVVVGLKIMQLNCCTGARVWSFCSSGLAAFGQDEVVLALEWHQDDNMAIPRDAFRLYRVLFENAIRGSPVSSMDHLLFPGSGLLGWSEHAGFLFVRRTLQCSDRLIKPNPLRESDYLVALLLLKSEVPWAKLFPLRLLLRLGAEFRYYPCPLVSVRFRKPVYFDGDHHSIMSILADFRNYQYTIQNIPGLIIRMIGKKTTILAPRNRYELMMKASTTNENILSLGANFSSSVDSHLVCIQADDGAFQSQTINIASAQVKATGASFVVFSGAVKSNSGFTAKMSIVEDGLLVQISPADMVGLKQSIHAMQDYTIVCRQTLPTATQKSSESESNSSPTEQESAETRKKAFNEEQDSEQELVELKWVENERTSNEGVLSAVDGASLAGVPSCRIFSGTDYSNERFIFRWTEVFFLASKQTE